MPLWAWNTEPVLRSKTYFVVSELYLLSAILKFKSESVLALGFIAYDARNFKISSGNTFGLMIGSNNFLNSYQ